MSKILIFIRFFALFISIVVFFTSTQSQASSKECFVAMTLYRANMKPLANKLVTFRSDDKKHHVEVITKKNGYCEVNLNQNTHYNIIYEDIFYTKMFKIPVTNRIDYNGRVIIDGGLFTIINLKVYDNMGDYDPLKGETILCESKSTGKLYENKTDQSGNVEFYVPRNTDYIFHSVYEKEIQSVSIDNGRGVTVYSISLKASTIPENQYHERIREEEEEAIAREKQRVIEDSLIGTIPITVVLFLNAEFEKEESKCPYIGDVNIYDSPDKKKFYGMIRGHWNVQGLCEKGIGLCSRVIKNDKGEYIDAVLPVKLKRGIHQLYLENGNGDFKHVVDVNVRFRTSYKYLINNTSTYYITAPMCVIY